MTKKHDVSKLPKWAQQEITRLEASVAHYRNEVTAMHTGATDTYLWRLDNTGRPERLALPPGSRIIFLSRSGGEITAHLTTDQELELHEGTGRRLCINPVASNTITVY